MAKDKGGFIGFNGLEEDPKVYSGVWSLPTHMQNKTGWPVFVPEADFLVIAGGAGGGDHGVHRGCGGGGAGGYRTSYGTSGGGASAESSLSITTGVTYTVTVGAGGAGGDGVRGHESVYRYSLRLAGSADPLQLASAHRGH